jgi:nitrate reductase gamma subunit
MTEGAMKRVLIGLLLVTAVLAGTARAETGSWFIDGERRHLSAHGAISCQECHGQIDLATHPDPRILDRAQVAPFDPEQCAGCHDSPEGYLTAGEHGGRRIESLDQVAHCLDCHDPHYQISAEINPAFDPARPMSEQCASCHEKRTGLTEAVEADRPCLDCHLQPEKGLPQSAARSARFCLSCHARTSGTARNMPQVAAESLKNSPHAGQSCLDCHPGADNFGHGGLPAMDCLACHSRHDEKKAHDAHLSVSCQACHLAGVRPAKDPASGTVLWEIVDHGSVHALADVENEESCRRCHVAGNQVGAAAAVLPAKSIICLPCHAATLSAGDPISVAALVILAAGLLWLGSIWKGGTGSSGKPGAGRKTGLAGVLFKDVLLQRRLWQRSPRRWAIHGLIFYGMLLRLLWGLAALTLSLAAPDWTPTWVLVDKNAPITALIFDLTGLMILAGVTSAGIRHLIRPATAAQEGLPRPDWPALILLGLVAISGFVAEGLRLALTGSPPASGAAFIGGLVGAMVTGRTDLAGLYPYFWYLHAGLWGALMAYLPFSRQLHVILAPVVLVMNSARKH